MRCSMQVSSAVQHATGASFSGISGVEYELMRGAVHHASGVYISDISGVRWELPSIAEQHAPGVILARLPSRYMYVPTYGLLND